MLSYWFETFSGSFYPNQTYFVTYWTDLILPINQWKHYLSCFGLFFGLARILTEIYQISTISLGLWEKLLGGKKLAFKGQEGHATVKQPPLHAHPLNFWNLKMVLGNKGHIGVMVWYGSKCEKGQRFGLFWPLWPLKVIFFQKIQFWNMISLWLKFGKIMLACSRENW